MVSDHSGRIWFSLDRGVPVIDPSRRLYPRKLLRVPADRHRIVFSFARLSLSTPERVKYRYMLDGFDHGWSEAAATRGPGTEATAALKIDPMIWQTWWFYGCVALALCLALVAVYRFLMRRLAGYLNMRFETRIARELRVAVDSLPEDSPAKRSLDGVLQLMRRVIDEGRNTLQGLCSFYGSTVDLEQSFSSIPNEIGADKKIPFRVLRCGSHGHWGRTGMRERADRIGAQFHVWSSAAGGTEVQLSVPAHTAFQAQTERAIHE